MTEQAAKTRRSSARPLLRAPTWREEVANWEERFRVLYEERAAIMEADGGLPRAEAEREAFKLVAEQRKKGSG